MLHFFMAFEWDPNKATGNILKHEVTFEEAATVFDDPLYITFLDEEHTVVEERYITIGMSNLGRVLLVAHADRDERIRIISARKATKHEQRFYAEHTPP